MRIWRDPLYNKRGGFRRYPGIPMPRLRFSGRMPSPPVFCPEAAREIAFAHCLECPEFRVWNARDGDFRRCRQEYLALQAKGYYDGTWAEHPENFDPETFAEIQERKRVNEQFAQDFEREKAEMARLAEALEQYEETEEEQRNEDEDRNEY
jgi:hypothetical protein